MGSFDKKAQARLLGEVSGVSIYKLTSTLTYSWKEGGEKYRVVMPVGFITDFASTGLDILPPDDPHYKEAAILHDYLCQRRVVWKESGGELVPVKISRYKCDQLFLEGMKALGCPWGKRTLVYSAVRVYALATLTL